MSSTNNAASVALSDQENNDRLLRRMNFHYKCAYAAKTPIKFYEAHKAFQQAREELKSDAFTVRERSEFERITQAFTHITDRFDYRVDRKKDSSATLNPALTSAIVSPITANYAKITNIRLTGEIAAHKVDIKQTNAHTSNIRVAQNRFRTETVARGVKYKNNSVASRAGYMVENATAESINVDAVIKKSPVRARVPDSNGAGSPDIVVTNSGGEELYVSSKYHDTATKSAKAQTDPRLNGQARLVPKDQLTDGKVSLNNRAYRENLRGRANAAAQQKSTADALVDRIQVDGVESTPMTKKNAHDLAKAVIVDGNGDAVVNTQKVDKVMDDTGITAKVNKAVEKNESHVAKRKNDIVNKQKMRSRTEIKGATIAAFTAAAATGLVTAVSELIQNGVTTETVQVAAMAGLQSGTEGGLVALGAYGATRTAGARLCNVATNALSNAGVNVTTNLASGVGVGVMGAVATAAVSVYSFAKMKSQGATTREALAATGKNAAISLGVTAATGLATFALGVTAGIVVSAAIGIGMIGYSLLKAFRSRWNKPRSIINTRYVNPCFARRTILFQI